MTRKHNNQGSHRGLVRMNMLKRRIVMVGIAFMLMMCIAMPFVEALRTDTVVVSTDEKVAGKNVYDGEARLWSPYIVWRRGIDLDDSGTIAWSEPSWIMINNINTGVSQNITPDYDAGFRVGSNYYHAKNPDIWNGKVIYEQQYGTLSTEVRLYMHNISQGTEWQMPTDVIHTYAGGSFYSHRVYGEWVTWGSQNNAYLMDYENPDIHFHAVDTTLNQILKYSLLTDEYAIYSYQDTGAGKYFLKFIDLETFNEILIDCGTGSAIDYSVYEGLMGVTINVAGQLKSYVVDIANLTTGSYVWSVDFPSRILYTLEMTGYNIYSPFIWENNVVYMIEPTGQQPSINIYNMDTNETQNLTDNAYRQFLFDFKGDKIIYHDNTFSDSHLNNVRDDFDIFRTLTETEAVGFDITAIIPLIIVFMVIGAILGALKMFGGGW